MGLFDRGRFCPLPGGGGRTAQPEYQKVKTDLEDITRLYDGYVQRMDNGGILSPAEAADMDDLEDIQYRLEKELDELRPVRTFVRMEGVPPTQPEEKAAPEPPANPRPEPFIPRNFRFSTDYDLYPGGAKTKYKNNILAIKTLKQIEAEQRTGHLGGTDHPCPICGLGWPCQRFFR